MDKIRINPWLLFSRAVKWLSLIHTGTLGFIWERDPPTSSFGDQRLQDKSNSGFFRWVKLVTEASPWSQTGLLPKNAVAVQTQGKQLPTPNDSSGFGVALDLTGTQLMGVDFWSKAPIFPLLWNLWAVIPHGQLGKNTPRGDRETAWP